MKTKPLLLVALLSLISLTDSIGQVAVAAFQNVPQLRSNLIAVGVGPMKRWWSDGLGWMSASNYYEFGPAAYDVLHDNLAIYLESDNEKYVKTAKLNLTAFNRTGDNSAYLFMAKKTPKLFQVIKLPLPPGLIAAVKAKKIFSYAAKTYSVKTDWDPGPKADSYRLIIESK